MWNSCLQQEHTTNEPSGLGGAMAVFMVGFLRRWPWAEQSIPQNSSFPVFLA
jgi:hypothetical protein